MANPRLRFKRPDGSEYPDWETMRLEDVAAYKSGNLTAKSCLPEGPYKLFDATGQIGFADTGFDTEIITIIKDGAGIGRLAYLPPKSTCLGTMGVIANKESVSLRYLYEFLQTVPFQNYRTGSGIPHVYFNDYKHIATPVPSPEEQAKIAAFLSAVDDVIAATSREVADLELMKRGAMQRIFSREVRFYRDDGSAYPRWKTTTLSKVVTLKKGQQIPKDAISETGRYEHMNGGTTASGRTDLANTEANTISISEGGNSCGHVRWNAEPFYSGGHNYTLRDITNETTAPYLYQYLKNQEAAIMRLRVGSGLPNIQAHALRRFPVLLPCLEEQAKIAEFLTAMDTAIAKAKAELDLWRLLKRGLTQQMFVVHANA